MTEENYPSWRQELKSYQKKEGKSVANRWIQIATINKRNEPRLRTVVFRGWSKENSMIVFTDRRSEKVKDIENNNNIEVLWLLPKSKVQFRFKGYANIVVEDIKYWNKLNEKSRSLWFWPSPGDNFNKIDNQKTQNKELKSQNFLVYEISINKVELLKLKNPIHERYIWDKNKNWVQTRINA
tara:strand:+ start:6110 stop:6655 length:546 start_codon:yes stop_codon:yes gene_type:complete